jgi:hypothetical protein
MDAVLRERERERERERDEPLDLLRPLDLMLTVRAAWELFLVSVAFVL